MCGDIQYRLTTRLTAIHPNSGLGLRSFKLRIAQYVSTCIFNLITHMQVGFSVLGEYNEAQYTVNRVETYVFHGRD